MRVVIVGNDARGAALHSRLVDEGHLVRVCRNHVPDELPWQSMMDVDGITKQVLGDIPDIVVCLHVESSVAGLVDELRRVSRGRFAVFGVSKTCAALEVDRLRGIEAAEYCGWPVPRWSLVKYADRSGWAVHDLPSSTGWVVKEGGLAGGIGTHFALTEQCLSRLLRVLPPGDLLVQERIVGSEFAFAVVRGKEVCPIDVNFEYKREGEGETGRNTPGMGSVVTRWNDVFQGTLLGLPGLLDEMGYVGPLDASFMIDRDRSKAYFLEFTARFGNPELVAELQLMSHTGEFLMSVARGEDIEPRWMTSTWSAAVVSRRRSESDISATGNAQIGRASEVFAGVGLCAEDAVAASYSCISPESGSYRRDIGHDVGSRYEALLAYLGELG